MTVFRIGSGALRTPRSCTRPAERGHLNALVFECLAERTIALAQPAAVLTPKLALTRC